MKKYLICASLMVCLIAVGPLCGHAGEPADTPVLRLSELDTAAPVIRAKLDSVSDEDFLYRPDLEADTDLNWVYERTVSQETVVRRIELDPANGRVRSWYRFEVIDELTCDRVLKAVFIRDSAETVAEEEGLFDVCENVRSVSRDRIRLRWQNKELGKELTVNVQRSGRDVTVQYTLPFMGH